MCILLELGEKAIWCLWRREAEGKTAVLGAMNGVAGLGFKQQHPDCE